MLSRRALPTFYAVYQESNTNNPAMRAFIEWLQNQFENLA